MKKKSIVRIALVLLLFVASLSGYLLYRKVLDGNVFDRKERRSHSSHQIAGTETPIDSSLISLIKPVNEQVIANIPVIKAENSTRIFSVPVQGTITYDTRNESRISSRIAGRIERMYIHYNFQPVKKGQLLLEIYSPDLSAAQRELLLIYQSEGNSPMLERAKERLSLLGMQAAQVQQVLRTKNILYKIPVYSNASGYILEKQVVTSTSAISNASSTSTEVEGEINMGGMTNSSNSGANSSSNTISQGTPLLTREGQYVGPGETLFTIYNTSSQVAEFAFEPSLTSEVRKGEKLVFYRTSDPETVFTGIIGLIQPTFRQGSNFTLARVYTIESKFPIGELVTAKIPLVNSGWWLPQSAVINLGSKKVVFKKEGNVFVPKGVTSKINREGLVLITENIKDWEVASNASYLVDSESFIKTGSDSSIQQ
jgi:membrane fusion protein, copper/silver efflux system